MKPVLLHILFNGGLEFDNIECETVQEAKLAAEACEHFKPEFSIYTIYSSGKPSGVTWDIDTNHATNLRENKKAKKKKSKRASYNWSDTEIKILLENYESGLKIGEIAKGLHRTYNAVYSKLVQQGAITPEKRT